MICPESGAGRRLDTLWQHIVQINYVHHPMFGVERAGTTLNLGGTESGLSFNCTAIRPRMGAFCLVVSPSQPRRGHAATGASG